MQTIGFIGLGNMGGNMAARYLAAGHTVYGTARHRDRAQALVDQGLRWARTPREVADAVDVILTSLPNEEIVRSVASGADGILAGLGEGKVWADLSTISPRASRDLAERVRHEGRGAQMLDTPVSGSVPQVKAGTLTIMVGGDADAYARVEPVLRLLGSPTHIGDNGQGLVLKLAVNISLAVQTLAFSEGLLLAERDGIDAHLAARVMAESQIGSPMLKLRVPLMLTRPMMHGSTCRSCIRTSGSPAKPASTWRRSSRRPRWQTTSSARWSASATHTATSLPCTRPSRGCPTTSLRWRHERAGNHLRQR
jgi:3-hydroxyisobutyrate dehydrogenase-like beta-hydroxyacid dehydrogenase